MEYNINDFVFRLRRNMEELFPREKDFINLIKHKNRPLHIVDVAFKRNGTIYIDENIRVFEIGNAYAEKYYPYYHILEDAPVIRKKGRGSEKTKGSQDKIGTLSKRDYGIVNFNGKTFTKEYTKNVRGARQSVIDRSTRFVVVNGKRFKYNADSDSYKNIHYHYIENMLNEINPMLASEYGLKYGRVGSSGLKEEYVTDKYNIGVTDYDTMTSFINQILGMWGNLWKHLK